MLFAAYLGARTGLGAWHNALQRHADWLGLGLHEDSRRLDDRSAFAFGFLRAGAGRDSISPTVLDGAEYLILTTMADAMPVKDARTDESLRSCLTGETPPTAIRIGVSLRTGRLTAAVPVTSVEPLFFARCGEGWALSTDLRFLARLLSAEVDERGIYAILRFGAIPPPLSMFKGTRRVPNGHLLTITAGSAEPAFERFFHLEDSFLRKGECVDPERRVIETLDGVLGAMPGPVIVYFSGGVDSSLLAARLSALGLDDFTLVNASFGPDDASARIAREMARALGLPCEQTLFSPSSIPAILERLGRDYVYPFGDPATLPGNLLIHASLAAVPSTRSALTGVGAGPVFGQGMWLCRQQVRAGRLPRPVVRAGSKAYEALNLWRHPSTLERSASTLRRLADASLAQTTLAQNALDGIAYHTPEHLRCEIRQAIGDYTEALATGARSFWDQRSVLHAAKYSSHDFSAIAHAPLAARGVRAANPFIEPCMLRLSASLTEEDLCPGGVLKGLLKKVLARSVPPELVYAPARSFVPPFRGMFNSPSLRAFFDDFVLTSDNPLLEFVRVNRVREMVGRVQNGQPVSSGARKFVWTFTFTSAWLSQISEG